ncbi:ATPase [Clostridia bacterium]|nr:ATPase [Clostridia bacterium]
MDSKKLCGSIINNVERAIRGKREAVESVLLGLLCGGHVLVEDVPGVGKTRLAVALTKTIDASFGRIQFTPDVLPSDVTGFSVFSPKTREFEFRRGAVMNEFLLADEINRTSPKTQSSLLEAMEERQVTVDGVTYPLPELFMVLATQNPIEHTSTYPLPEAQLDRFLIKISIGYPDARDELNILLGQTADNDALDNLAPVASAADVVNAQREVSQVYINSQVGEYIVSLVDGTRRHDAVALGASVRGTLALGQAARAFAYMDGRDFVTPDDVHRWLPYALSHRVTLKRGAAQRSVTVAGVLSDVRGALRVPK